MFNLTTEIAAWRKSILETETCTENDVDELESHLKEELDQLKTQKLTEQEAFVVAACRIGHPIKIADEFAKVNRALVFRNHIFWVCIGMLSFIVITALAITISSAATFLASFTKLNNYEMAIGAMLTVCQITVFIVIASLLYNLIKKGRTTKLSTFFKTKTRAISVILSTIFLYTAVLALSFFFIMQTVDAADSGMFSGLSRFITIIDYYLITCFVVTPIFLTITLIKFRPHNYGRPSHV